jgi:hypothetical protein
MDTIETLADKFQEDKWKAYASSLEDALALAHKKIKTLEDQLAAKEEKTTEQIICEMEIEKLKLSSVLRSLTLEETKRLDLLVKNLILSKEANKTIKKDNGPSITISEAALIAIASIPEADDGTN